MTETEITLTGLSLCLLAVSVFSVYQWARAEYRRIKTEAKLQYSIRRREQDAASFTDHTGRLDRIYAALQGYIPTDFDPPTEE